MLREYIENEPYIPFYACGKPPYNMLSNFAYIKEGIEYDGLRYISTEHAFQAQKYIKEQRKRFSVEGDLGQLDSGFDLAFGKDWEKKKLFWMKKNNIGIIPKMVTNEKRGLKLGLIRDKNFVNTSELWFDLLWQKFRIDRFRKTLTSTGNNYLLEYDRGAERMNPLWSGIIKDGKLYGTNLMGKYIMYIREKIYSQEEIPQEEIEDENDTKTFIQNLINSIKEKFKDTLNDDSINKLIDIIKSASIKDKFDDIIENIIKKVNTLVETDINKKVEEKIKSQKPIKILDNKEDEQYKIDDKTTMKRLKEMAKEKGIKNLNKYKVENRMELIKLIKGE